MIILNNKTSILYFIKNIIYILLYIYILQANIHSLHTLSQKK